jgi:hypothetical protein
MTMTMRKKKRQIEVVDQTLRRQKCASLNRPNRNSSGFLTEPGDGRLSNCKDLNCKNRRTLNRFDQW